MADAVPGWFQAAALTLRDPSGRELAFAGSYRFQQDPVWHYEIPRDGRYVIEIADSVFRGREDFVYRLALGELPLVAGPFPWAAAGKETNPETPRLEPARPTLAEHGRGKPPGSIRLEPA